MLNRYNVIDWILYWQWKTEKMPQYRMAVSVSVVYSITWLTGSSSLLLYTTTVGKDKNSKYAVYWMHSTLATLKWKNKVKPSLNLEISIVDNDINKGKL